MYAVCLLVPCGLQFDGFEKQYTELMRNENDDLGTEGQADTAALDGRAAKPNNTAQTVARKNAKFTMWGMPFTKQMYLPLYKVRS